MKKTFALFITFIIVLSVFYGNAISARAIANAKISDDLDTAFETSDSSTALMCVTFSDTDHQTIMAEFQKRYPSEYEAYILSVTGDLNNSAGEISDDVLQSAIEHKRQIYRQYYATNNYSVLDDYVDSSEVLFVSNYAPFAIIETTSTTAFFMAQNTSILTLDSFSNVSLESQYVEIPRYENTNFTFPAIQAGINLSNQISRADYVRDTLGNSGAGVKIGMVEATGIPDISNSMLQGSTIITRDSDTTTSDHATVVSAMMVGRTQGGSNIGVAPDATLYSCITPDITALYSGIEWLIDSGVNVINGSLSSEKESEYGDVSKWLDHVAVMHDVHLVFAAGNSYKFVNSLGLAYNAIAVGSFNANNSITLSLYEISGFSSYVEATTDRPEKPNIVANGVLVQPIEGDQNYPNGFAGTSFAAPQVTGVIAQLCSYSSVLKVKQSSMGAILSASAALKVDSVGTGSKGDSFSSAVRVEGNTQISDVEGAGILDARWARGIVASENYWSPVVYASGFPYSKYVYIDATSNTVNRVAIFWLKRNELTNHTSDEISGQAMANLNLYVYDPNGTLVGSSTTSMGNFEIVQFIPTVSGNYRIEITGSSEEKEYIGIALW